MTNQAWGDQADRGVAVRGNQACGGEAVGCDQAGGRGSKNDQGNRGQLEATRLTRGAVGRGQLGATRLVEVGAVGCD